MTLRAPVSIACISDTHMAHQRLTPAPADVLIHAGDFTQRGTEAEARSFFRWLSDYPAQHKLVIAGNHDRVAEHQPDLIHQLATDAGAVYLCDTLHEVMGLRVWGSPWTPRFRDMAFNLDRGADIAARWQLIPDRLDLLITHGPPKSTGDRTFFGACVGCADLTLAVAQKSPRHHIFGHIHEAAGSYGPRAGRPTESHNVASCHLIRKLPLRAPTTLQILPHSQQPPP